ncbi:ATP-binding protein [Seonamhaeicola sp. MEBiC1930]|uniref:hybrid sensor histidine kinase/response regulator transcription factor n=1 Tax=Seonamhaeicola sp. MEBiC01930 TaxID=2976768 RepID=UPI00324EB1F6
MKDGMSQVSVNDMIHDSNGFVWIGTADGLDRFDGNVFKQFKHNPNDSTSISGNYITKIVEGINGEILIGTSGNGLNIFDPETDSFKKINLESSAKNEIITGIAVDTDGDVLVSTVNNGLFILSNDDGRFNKKYYLSNLSITNVFKDRKGVIWLGTLKGEVYGYTDDFDEPIIKFKVGGNVQSFFRGYNHLFVGTYDGFFSYNFDTTEIKSIELEASGDFKTMHVVDFLKENDTHIWVATSRGLYLYDYLNSKVEYKIEYQQKTGTGLSNNTVQSLLKVSPSLLYVGTANELSCLEFNASGFNNISKNKKGKNILNDNVIFSIYKDKNLWVGTSDGGLNLITKNKTYFFIDNQNDPNTIAGSVVRAIVHDEENNRMWFATTRGLSLLNLNDFNPNRPVFKNFYFNPTNNNSINSNFLKDLELDSKNNLWGATHEHGIFKLVYRAENNYKFTRFSSEVGNKNTLVHDATNCIEIDDQDNIWVGTQNGISKIYTDDDKGFHFENYVQNNALTSTLPHKSVNDILVDDSNQVWVGTRNGLCLLNEDGSFMTWTAQKQFPNALIYSLQDDLEGNLWLGTNDGLVRFAVENNQFYHYSSLDNIQGREFDTHARFRDDQGYVYLGGVDGVTYFNPNQLKLLDDPKILYFSQLRIKDEIVSPRSNILNKAIEKTSEIEFSHDQFPFYLKFSTTDFRFDKNAQYAYRLLPLDDGWNFLNDTEIQFLSLPVGDYNLEVNGFSRGEEWSKPPLSIKLKVNPPWWLTTVAIIAYIFTLVLLTYWFYRFLLSRKLALAESERLKEIDQLKNSLYTNITHEFRTPITVILGMIDTLETNFGKPSKALEKPLHLIKNNSESLLKMVNDMLDLTKLESAEIKLNMTQSDIVSFIKYLFESYQSLANEKRIKYTFYSEIDYLLMDFDKEKMATVVTNLLINAIKFTPSDGEIICHLNTKGESDLFLKIVDTGVGIPKEDLSNIFEKFYQSKKASSPDTRGTGIGLALTKELVELMKGRIKVASKELLGSEFVVTLPITNSSKIVVKSKDSDKTKTVISNSKQKVKNESVFEITEKSTIALIIEDNKDVAYYLQSCLEDKYQVIHAADGEDGIKKAFKYIPDIIISDVMMPKKNGFEVCNYLKTEMATNHIPIILLTAKASDEAKVEGLTYGADAYLIKPFNKKELFARINQLVNLRKKMIEKFGKEDFKEFIERKDENPDSIFIKKVIEEVNEAIDDSEFGAAQLASKLHLSESQVYRKIKAITNRSTAVFIRSVRLNKAKLLLQTTNKTISQVAYEVGFNDPSWFSRVFKDEFGHPPSDISKT